MHQQPNYIPRDRSGCGWILVIAVIAFVLIIVAMASCTSPVQPKPITIYEVIIDSQLADNKWKSDTLNLPADYRLVYDSTKKGWIAAFHTEFGDDQYLEDGAFHIIFLYFNQDYGTAFPHARDAAKLIKRHWQEILDDRASHEKGGKK